MRRLPRLALAFFLLFVTCAGFPAWGQDQFSGRVIEVVNGDEIRVRLDTWDVTVHLHGVEIPVTSPEFSERAQQYTARRVADTRVRVEVRGTGPHKMVYGEVYPVSGGSLNEELVRAGIATWAQAYAPKRLDLEALEKEAQQAKRGQWGDSTGRNVALPPSAADAERKKESEAIRAAQERPKNAAPSSPPTPTPLPTPALTPASAPPPTAFPAPTTAAGGAGTTAVRPPTAPRVTWAYRLQELRNYLRTAYAPPPPGQAFRPMFQPLLVGWGTFSVIAFLLLLGAGRGGVHSVPYQIICSILIGAAVTIMLPLPLLILSHYLPYSRDSAAIAIALPLGVFLWRKAIALCRRDQTLRGTPRYRLADAPHGFVRVSGEATASPDAVHSVTGTIPAVYFREITHAYRPQTEGKFDRARNSLPHRWELVSDETEAADFLIEDESGAALVSAEKAAFYPLRVALFYNEIPVESFPSPPYSGDTRTQIHFLPERANVTVWGRRYQSSSPGLDAVAERIGYDSMADCLIVVEETPSRLYTRRPLLGLLVAIVALGLFGLAAYCLLTPSDLPPIRDSVVEYVTKTWASLRGPGQ